MVICFYRAAWNADAV